MPAGTEVGRAYVTIEYVIDRASASRVEQETRRLAGGGGRGVRGATTGTGGGGGAPVVNSGVSGGGAAGLGMRGGQAWGGAAYTGPGYVTVGGGEGAGGRTIRAKAGGKATGKRGGGGGAAQAAYWMAYRRQEPGWQARQTGYWTAAGRQEKARETAQAGYWMAQMRRGGSEGGAKGGVAGMAGGGISRTLGFTVGNIPRIMAAFAGIGLLAGAAVGAARILGRMARSAQNVRREMEKQSVATGGVATGLGITMGPVMRAQAMGIGITRAGAAEAIKTSDRERGEQRARNEADAKIQYRTEQERVNAETRAMARERQFIGIKEAARKGGTYLGRLWDYTTSGRGLTRRVNLAAKDLGVAQRALGRRYTKGQAQLYPEETQGEHLRWGRMEAGRRRDDIQRAMLRGRKHVREHPEQYDEDVRNLLDPARATAFRRDAGGGAALGAFRRMTWDPELKAPWWDPGARRQTPYGGVGLAHDIAAAGGRGFKPVAADTADKALIAEQVEGKAAVTLPPAFAVSQEGSVAKLNEMVLLLGNMAWGIASIDGKTKQE